MREIDRKHMMERLEELARWLEVMSKMTREPGMRQKHKERARAVRDALEELKHDPI